MEDFWSDRRSGWRNGKDDARDPWETDYGRIIHSSSFRRLQGKTQILNLGDSDFYRNRLTHSLEVGQIARGLVQQIKHNHQNNSEILETVPDPTMAQAIGFTHDLGHPPFGHGGEYALNYCMRDDGGFEGNGQTLRILSRLERFSANSGSDLTRRSTLGVLKYPVKYSDAKGKNHKPALSNSTSVISLLDIDACKPPKCYHDEEEEIVEWALEKLPQSDRATFIETETTKKGFEKSKFKSFDCTIMDLADDIAYGVHDLEDMITMRLISREDFEEVVSPHDCQSFLDHYASIVSHEMGNDAYGWLVDKLFGDADTKKRCISRFVGHFITNVQVKQRGCFQSNILDFEATLPDECNRFLKSLTNIVFKKVIKSPEVQHLEFKGQQLVVSVFEAYANDPDRFLPTYARPEYQASGRSIRVICDHIAGMTDNYLLRTYDRLFSPRIGSTFDRL